MKSPLAFLLSIVFWLQTCLLLSQSVRGSNQQEVGRRFIQNYSAATYDGLGQNWEVAQDQRGLIFVGNGAGLLEYDGVRWRSHLMPNRGAVFGLAIDAANRLFVGGPGEMGYFDIDSTGQLGYRSLRSVLPDSLQNFSYIIAVDMAGGSVFYRSPTHIFQLDQSTLSFQKAWTAPAGIFHKPVGEDLVMWRGGVEWGKVSGETLTPFPGDIEEWSVFPTFTQYPATDDNSDSLLIVAESGETSLFDGEALQTFPLGEVAMRFWEERKVWDVFPMDTKGFLFRGFPEDGIFIDHKGQGGDPISKASGFTNSQLSDAYIDQHQQVWLATNDGISKMDAFSSLSLLRSTEGLTGAVQAIVRHKGSLYAGTTNGLFILGPRDPESYLPRFQQIKGAATCWTLYSTEEHLVVGGERGIQLVQEDQVISTIPLSDVPTTIYCWYPSPFEEEVVYAGHGQGVFVLKRKGNSYQLIGSLEGLGAVCRTIIETAPGLLWIGTQAAGMLRFELPDSSLALITNGQSQTSISGTLTKFGGSDGIPSGIVNPYFIGSRVVIASQKGLRKFDANTKQFVLEPAFGEHLVDTSLFIFRIVESPNGSITVLHTYPDRSERGNRVSTFLPDAKGTYIHRYGELNLLPDDILSSVQVVYPDPEQSDIIWVGGTKGIVRYDMSLEKPLVDDFPVYLRAIKTIQTDSSIYLGNRKPDSPPEIVFDDNSLRFEFAAAFFQQEEVTKYQYMLEGDNNSWSKWSKETYVDVTNLQEGSYRFHVRARNVTYHISESEPFAFEILPPWYRTWWAYFLYTLLLIGGIALVVWQYSQWRVRQLTARNQELEQTVEERTQEIRQALENLKTTQDQLIVQEKMASLGQVTLGIAHEIKNPLNFVTNYAEVSVELADELEEEFTRLQDSIADDERKVIKEIIADLRENATVIRKNGQRADTIVSSMRNHASDNHGQRADVNLNQLVKERTDLAYFGYKSQEPYTPVELVFDLAAELPNISLNPQDIGRVILNLISNALEALHEKAQQADASYAPLLRIATQQQDQALEILIRDNGGGISPEHLAKVFQPFFTTKPTGQGNTGLGLSISYDIVVQGHQGTLTVSSEPGKYTEFVVSLPLG